MGENYSGEEKDFCISVDGVPVRGELYAPPERPGDNSLSAPFLVFCHGIPAGNASPEKRSRGYRLWGRFLSHRRGYPVVFFNFRGTGVSGGNLNLKEWCADLRAVLDWCESTAGSSFPGAVLVGFSAGATVAVEVASSDRRVKGVAAGACPVHFDFLFEGLGLKGVMEWIRTTGLFRDSDYPSSPEKWREDFLSVRPRDKISSLSPRPLLLLHGLNDHMVPADQARELYQVAGKPCELQLLKRAGHQLRNYPRVFHLLLSWMHRHNL